MTSSDYIGRIGGLAAALGVGAAVFMAPAVAWADPDATANNSANSSASESDTPAAPSRGDSPRARKSDTNAGPAANGRTRTGRVAADLTPSDSTPSLAEAITTPRRNRASSNDVPSAAAATAKAANTAPAVAPAPAATAAPASVVAPALAVPSVTAGPAASLPALTLPPAVIAKITPLLQWKPTVKPVLPSVLPNVLPNGGTTLASVADRLNTVISTAVSRFVDALANGSPFAPAVESPANWLLLAFTRKQILPAQATTSLVQANVQTLPVVLDLNGYNVVPASIEKVVSFYGQWTYWPGVSSTTQGKQDFSLVDPNTQQTVGNFTALIQQGDPTSLGTKYVELLVTANDGQNVGTDPGQTPPVGSLISSWTALGMFGWKYSSMPTSPDTNKVTFKAVTPFGDVPIPFFWYDAGKGIANHTFDNKPIDVTNGFSIVPADPVGEKIKGTSGLLPLFNAIQGEQRFNVVDSNGTSVGSFQGEFTTTGDVLGISTEAIRVTANDGINVGTGAGQVPPVGSVYNVAYLDLLRSTLLYSSKPTANGTVIDAVLMTPFGNIKFPTRLDASIEPAIKLVAPGGKTFVASSDAVPAGVNGLPPRDVQIQNYQQFDVLDSDGNKIGNVDADTVSQWDSYGAHSKSLLITKINEGTPGTDASNVPTVGTVVNVIYFGKAGFGVSDSITPIPTGEVRAFQFLTPWGIIPLSPSTVPVGRLPVEYYTPFEIV